jgi:small conductance mechanosensitive channel
MNPKLTPHQLDAYTAMLWTWAVTFIPHIVTAVLILIIGSIIAKWIGNSTQRILDRAGHIDITVTPVIAAAIKYSILILVLVAALSQVGVQTASLLAVLGAAGLAIGLALQGTLTNIAAGIMLLWLRPFRLGDFIEVPSNNISGVVREIGLFVSLLENLDGISVVAPNSQIWNATLRNHTRNSGRLLSLSISLKNTANVDQAREVLVAMLKEDSRVSRVQAPLIFVDSLTTSTIVLTCAFRAAQGNLGELERTIISRVTAQLHSSGNADLAPQQITLNVPATTDPARLLAATSIAQS